MPTKAPKIFETNKTDSGFPFGTVPNTILSQLRLHSVRTIASCECEIESESENGFEI